MSQTIPAWRDTVPYLRQVSFAEMQTVTNVIQTQCVAQLGKNHGHNMARCRKSPRLNFVLGFKFFDKFSRNVLDNLPQHCQIMLLRSHGFVLCLVEEKKVTWDLFFVKSEKFYGIAVEKIHFGNGNDLTNKGFYATFTVVF